MMNFLNNNKNIKHLKMTQNNVNSEAKNVSSNYKKSEPNSKTLNIDENIIVNVIKNKSKN